jgi:hypothetical protein
VGICWVTGAAGSWVPCNTLHSATRFLHGYERSLLGPKNSLVGPLVPGGKQGASSSTRETTRKQMKRLSNEKFNGVGSHKQVSNVIVVSTRETTRKQMKCRHSTRRGRCAAWMVDSHGARALHIKASAKANPTQVPEKSWRRNQGACPRP